MKVHAYSTKEQATIAAVEMFGALCVEMEAVQIFKITPTISKCLNLPEGYGFEEKE